VALANRGVTNPDAFPDVEHIQIDRDAGDVGNLKGRSFDVVVDVNAYVPRAVRQVAEVLGDVGRVLFVSTCAVYDVDAGRTGSVGEDWPVVETADPASEDADALYGELKVLCEREALRWRPDATLIVRPGFIVGGRHIRPIAVVAATVRPRRGDPRARPTRLHGPARRRP
jgi:2'-hydroxyisoflavone reductase